jgi:hypothetical protein
MWPFLRTLLMGVTLTVLASCGGQVVVGDPPTATLNPQAAQNFTRLGSAAAKACGAQISGQGNAEAILTKAGYSKGRTTRTFQSFVRDLDGGKKSISGKPVGGTSVRLPLVAERSGRKKCFVGVSGFSKVDGDIFYRAFQASARGSSIGASLRIWGRYEHGRSSMGMAY